MQRDLTITIMVFTLLILFPIIVSILVLTGCSNDSNHSNDKRFLYGNDSSFVEDVMDKDGEVMFSVENPSRTGSFDIVLPDAEDNNIEGCNTIYVRQSTSITVTESHYSLVLVLAGPHVELTVLGSAPECVLMVIGRGGSLRFSGGTSTFGNVKLHDVRLIPDESNGVAQLVSSDYMVLNEVNISTDIGLRARRKIYITKAKFAGNVTCHCDSLNIGRSTFSKSLQHASGGTHHDLYCTTIHGDLVLLGDTIDTLDMDRVVVKGKSRMSIPTNGTNQEEKHATLTYCTFGESTIMVVPSSQSTCTTMISKCKFYDELVVGMITSIISNFVMSESGVAGVFNTNVAGILNSSISNSRFNSKLILGANRTDTLSLFMNTFKANVSLRSDTIKRLQMNQNFFDDGLECVGVVTYDSMVSKNIIGSGNMEFNISKTMMNCTISHNTISQGVLVTTSLSDTNIIDANITMSAPDDDDDDDEVGSQIIV